MSGSLAGAAAASLCLCLTLLAAPAAAQSATPARGPIGRWIDLQAAALNLRFRYVDTSDDRVTTRQLQHRQFLRGRLRFDPRGRYTVGFGVQTGPRFTSSWDNTGWGLAPASSDLALKTLSVAAQPFTGLEAEAGGIAIVRGESTEITTYDEDGSVMGERITVRRPRELFFDDIAFTNAYISGRPDLVAVTKRFRYLDDPNYQQFLVRKVLGRARVSADYTVADGAATWRQAINLRVPETGLLDAVLVEAYQRTRSRPDEGFAVTGEKAIGRRLAISGGYASIDPAYGGLNADRFNIGKRVFLGATYNFTPEVQAGIFATTAVGDNVPLPQRTLTNVVLTYNAIPALKRTGLF